MKERYFEEGGRDGADSDGIDGEMDALLSTTTCRPGFRYSADSDAATSLFYPGERKRRENINRNMQTLREQHYKWKTREESSNLKIQILQRLVSLTNLLGCLGLLVQEFIEMKQV